MDAKAATMSVRDRRITKALRLLNDAIVCLNKPARELARIVGSIIAMGPALSRLASIMTRHCQITVAAPED